MFRRISLFVAVVLLPVVSHDPRNQTKEGSSHTDDHRIVTARLDTIKPFGEPKLTICINNNVVVFGQPIAIDITIVNSSGACISFLADSSSRSFLDHVWETLPTTSKEIRPAPSLDEPNISTKNICIHLPPGEKWIGRDYLQMVIRQPQPGLYRLPYRFELPYYFDDTEASSPSSTPHKVNPSPILIQEGVFEFTVKATLNEDVTKKVSSTDLLRMIRLYMAQLQNDEYKAEAALSAIDDHLVIPFLIQRHRYLSSLPLQRAFARFANDIAAHEIVKSFLYSEHEQDVIESLYILAEWRVPIDIRLLRLLLQTNPEKYRSAVLRYCLLLGIPSPFAAKPEVE